MTKTIIQFNNLERDDTGVWVKKGSIQESSEKLKIADSDEKYLYDVIRDARDLSSTSDELDSKWVYWPTEYHLSSSRVNLIRGIDLSNIHTALEIHAGCGAITRYLGENSIKLDALEERPLKAEIIKKRCFDLDNVTVLNVNFKNAIFPECYYDAIFGVDLIDKAALMVSSCDRHPDAVIKTLSRLKTSLTEEGLLLIAASNRFGLKYQMGALDGVYSRPYIGVNGYPENPPIRNYNHKEWSNLLKSAGFEYFQFAYPFPDHLLTRVVLHDAFVRSDPYAHSLLYHTKSRDYFNPQWRPDDDEFLRWETLHGSGYLPDFANSFLIIASKNRNAIQRAMPYDFVHFSNPLRQNRYAVLTYKRRGELEVRKKNITKLQRVFEENRIDQTLDANDYLHGPLLCSIWLHALMDPEPDKAFEGCLNQYRDFLITFLINDAKHNKALDLLPFNIIIDSNGEFKTFDLEWQLPENVSPDFILFRALMWFAYTHEVFINSFCEFRHLQSIGAFIQYGFSLLGLQLDQKLAQFIAFEERVHDEIGNNEAKESVEQLVNQPFQYVNVIPQSQTYSAQLYWVSANDVLTNENSVTVSAPLGDNEQELFFQLPKDVTDVRILRFDPADRTGFFHLSAVQLEWRDANGKCDQVLWELDNAHQIADQAIMHDVHFCPSAMSDVFLSTSEDPRMIFELPYLIQSPSPSGVFLFKARMSWPKSADYLAAAEKIKSMALEINARDELIAEKEKRMVEYHAKLQKFDLKDARIKELKDQLSERDAKIAVLEYKMNLIEKSGLRKILKAFKRTTN